MTTRTALKITRKAPGVYTTTHNGVTYEIVSISGTVAGFGGWVWHVAGEQADDIHATKRDAVEALTHWVESVAA
jgi:hypothetical protein